MKATAWRILTRASLALALAFVFLPAGPTAAQRAPNSGAVAHKTAPDGKKVLTLADYGNWKRVTSVSLSDDGKWMTYTYAPNDGNDTLYVKQIDGTKLYTISTGSAGGRGGRGGGRGGFGGGSVQFSDDSHWIGYYVNPPARGAGRGRGRAGAPQRGGRGGAPQRGGGQRGGTTGGGAGANASAGPVRHFELLDLTTGAKWDVPNPSGFQFSKGSQWLAVKLNGTPGDSSHRGTDLLMRRLATGATHNIGNVSQYSFDDAGNLLAYTVDAADRLGNGVYVVNLSDGATRALDSQTSDYNGLGWTDSGSGLAVLRGKVPDGKTERANALVAWTDAGASGAQATVWDPAADPSFPKGFVLSENAAPRWSKDASRLFIGIKAQQDKVAEAEGPQANVDVWHWNDVVLQSEQMIRINQERRATFASVLNLPSKKFIRLVDDQFKSATPTADGAWAIERDPTPYNHDFSEGQPSRADYYRIDTATGAPTLMAKHLLRTMGTSPDSKWFLYLENKHVMAFNLDTGKTVTVDAATKSFINTDDDHAAEKPVWGVGGWTKDGKSVLLYDKYDLWSVPLDGSKGADLTDGEGASQQVQLRLARLGGGGGRGGRGGGFGGRGGGAAEPIDLSKPQTLSAYGEWTKKSGYWQLPAGGGTPTPLIWEDKAIGQAQKSKDADRVVFTEQTFQEFPDWWVSNDAFAAPRKVTDANPQISEYAWGRRVLVDYTNSKGKKLQATLTLPADYQPGQKYPMLVYIYEKLSNTHHQFSMPVYDDRPHMSEYASDGYLVLEPDIVYEIGHPGSSAVDCVTAAVKKVIDLGYADPQHIGLQGHSWGGYESSYILTQTNIFAAVVTGAPLTDLVSMYDELYKQTGAWNGGILETSQGRMGADVTPWNAKALYESESPVFNVTKIQTPFMILQGTSDGAVDWDQGLEFYNAARRNGKKVIFLSYPGEPHHLSKTENQKDFQVRMKQFFDHYLKGAPEPDWMKNGVPQVNKGGPIR